MSKYKIFGTTTQELKLPQDKPLYNLDLVNSQTIPPEYNFTRNSAGTYVGADGLIKTAAANEPRFEYDVNTGEFKGLLVEEQLTNIFRNHSTFSGQSCAASTSNSNWTLNGVSVSTNQTIAPDGTLSAARLTSTNGGYLASNASGFPTAFGVNVGTQRCLSIFAKAGSVSGVLFRQGGGSDYAYTFNIGTNAPEQIFQFGYSIKYPNGWFRVVISRYLSNGGAMLISTSPLTAGSSIFIWGPQGEIAERASSYISAPGNSNVTRQPDQLILNRPFNSLGTFFVEATPTTGTTLSADNGTSSLAMSSTGKDALYYNTNRTLRMSSDYSPALFNLSAPQNLNRVSLGHNALDNSSYINGYLKKFMYYGSPVTEDNLRSLTGNVLDTYRYNNDDIVTNGLVLNLDAGNPESYPGSGTTWTDLSGQGNNGTLVNGVGYDSANGGSLVFDGVNDSIDILNSNSLKSEYFTFDIWFRLNTLPVGGTLLLTSHYQGNGTISGLAVFEYQGQYWFQTRFNNSCCQNLLVGTSSTNTWVNFSGTWNGSIKVAYLNGIQAGTQSTSGTHSQLNNFSIGNNADNIAGGSYSSSANGYIPVVKYYNRALTQQEIQQNFNALRGRFGI